MSKKVSADSDLHRTLSPPPSTSHVGERHGTHYASAGDITSLSRPDSTSQSDSSETLGNPNQETLYHTALEMDQSSQDIPSGVDPNALAHLDTTIRVHEESTGQEDTGKVEDMDDKELYPLFSDNEFRDSKMNVASINDSQDFDKSPRQISFGADYSVPDRLENDSIEFRSFDDVMLTSTPVREKRKMKKTDNMSAALAFKTSSPIMQLTNESDDAGLKHEDRIIDAGIHMKEKVESSGSDDFPLSDGKELEYNASELHSQDVNAKDSTSTSPSVTTPVSSSDSRERDNVQADIDTENLVYTYSQDEKLLPTVSQRSSSELPTPMKPFKGESLEHQTLYAVETAGGDKDNESHAIHKQNLSVDDIPPSSLHGVDNADASHTIPDDSSATNALEASSFVLHCKDLASIVEAKMINSSKKSLSVRFSDEIIEIPPPDEFEMEQHDAHDSAFPIIGSNLDSLNIETGPALDSLDSMIDGTSIMKVNANILIGLRVRGSVEMMNMYQKKMNKHGKNDTPGSEMSLQGDQNYQNLEERGIKDIGEGSYSISHGGKTFQEDFQIEQSSIITPHQSTDFAQTYLVQETELQSKEEDLTEKSIDTQHSYVLIESASNDVIELKLPVEEAEGKTMSLDHQIESQGASHKLDHLIQDGAGEQSIKIEETGEKSQQISIEDLVSSTEIEHTVEKLNRHKNHEGFGEQPVEHELLIEKSVLKHSIESTGQFVQQVVQASESESETSLHEGENYQSLKERGLKDIKESSNSLNHRGKIFQQDFQIEQFSHITSHESVDSAESVVVKDTELPSKTEEKSIETPPSYVVIQGLSNINELKPPVEEADGKPKSFNNQIESQGASHKLDHLFQGGTSEQSIKIEETVKTCLQSHKSSTEGLASNIEIEHTSQRSSRYENHEGFGEQPVEHGQVLDKFVVKPFIESTGLSVQQAVQASEAGFEASFQEDMNYQRVEERGFKYIIEDSHSCLLPVLDSHSVSHKGKIFLQDFQNEQSSVITPHQSTYSAEFYFVKDMEQQSKEEKEEQIIGVSMETQPSYAVIQGAINDVIELKPPVAEAEAKSLSIDHQIESQGASHKLDHLIQDGTGEQSIKTEETGEKCLQSHKSSTEDIVSSTEIEHTIERLDRHENHEEFGEQPVVHDQVLVKSIGKSCTASIGQSVQQAAQTSECFRNYPPSLLEPYMSILEAAKKEPVIYPINAASDSASLKKVVLIDQLQQDGRTPLKNVEDGNVLSTFTSEINLTFANSEDSLSIGQSSLSSIVQPEHGQLNGSMVDDRTRYSETEVYQDSNQGKDDEEHSVPQKVTSKKDVSQPKINIRQIEEDLEPTLDISHFPGLKIKPRTRKIHLGPGGAGFIGPQDSLQKVIPPSQFLKMKQKRIVGKIQSTASSDSKAVASANQKQIGIGTIKDSQTTYSYKEKGKVDSLNVRQSTETTSYSDSEGNDRKVKTNKENTNATKEVPNSFSIEQKDSWQQLQAKPGSVLDAIENVPAGGSVPELKTASSQTEGNNHHTPLRADYQHEVLFDSEETNISKKEEGANTDPSTIMSQDYAIFASKSEPESMEKGVESSIHKNTQRIITGLTLMPCQGNTVYTKPNLAHDEENKCLREDCFDGKINNQKRDIADDMSGRNGNASNESHENINFDHTTPSKLPEIYHNKNIEEDLLEACKGQDNTTNHQVKDSDSLEMKGNEDKLLGYVEVQNTSPSDLLPSVKERKDVEDKSASDGELMHTTLTSLLDRTTHCEEMTDQSPGYGEFQYTTPSSLLHSVKEKKEVENKSPVYCELQYITPTRLFDRHIQIRKMSDQSPRYGEFQYKTPSDLFYRVMERNEGENRLPGYGELLYTTSSRLLERQIQSEEMSNQSPVYGGFQYTTPSGLLHRVKEGTEVENRSPVYGELKYTTPAVFMDTHMASRKMSDQSPRYGEFQYTTPSGVLHEVMNGNKGENKSPGYGEFPYTTPSRLLERHVQSEEMSGHSPGYGEFQYTTPSVLLHRAKERNESENKSPGYGELPYTTPSRLLERRVQYEEMSGHSPGYGELQYTTPSGLLYGVMNGNKGENKSPGYGEFPYTTPSRLLERHVQSEEMSGHSPGYGEFQYTTPSVLLCRAKERNEGENRSPGYGELPYTTPSRLLERRVQSEEMSGHSPGYGELQYTTPSGLLHRAKKRNEGESSSPGYGELPYTTPSRLLERHIQSEEMSGHSPGYRDRSRDSGENKYTSSSIYGELRYTTPSVFLESHMPSRKMSDQSPGYGEFQYATPSGLLYGVMNRNEGENKSPGYGEFPYTTPSRLLERHVQSEEMSGHSPGYGEFQYTTPSVLLYRAKERNEGENRSPGYGEFPYTTPSRLLERHIQSEEMSDDSPVYGEFQYTTPSGLLHRAKERKICEDKLPGHGEPLYTTPSRFLYKQIQRRELTDQSPGYEEFQYRTPQGLFSRDRKLNDGEDRSPAFGELLYTAPNKLLDRSIQSDKMSDQSPGYGELQYITPSGLLCRVSERKESENRSPDSGKNKHTAFSRLSDMDMKGREIPDHSPCFEESLNTTPSGLMHRDDVRQAFEEISPRYGKLCYITPSVLIYKDNKRQDSKEKLLLSGKFQHKMPSQLLAIERRREERDDKSPGHNTFRYSTPSLLLYQELLRRQNVDASSLGHRVPMQDTLTKVESRTDDEGYGYQEYTTPSQILEKSNKVTYASESSPCLEYHFATIPSQMLVRNFDRKKPENVTQGYEFPGNVSPSELFNRRKALEKGKSKPSEGHVHQYLRYPSGPLQMNMHRPYEIEYPLSDGEYRYSAPSRLFEAMNQRGPAEHMTGEASSSRHLLARDHDKYEKHKVSVEYTNPPIFIQKGEDRDQTKRSKTAEYGAFIDSTPLRLIDLENTTRLGQEPSSQSAVLRVCDLKGQKEGIMYQHEYTNSAVADRNTSTASFCMSENKVPATVQYPSTASFNKLYSKVPTAVGEFQYKTPSGVLHRVKERHEGVDRSLGYGEFLYAAPYRFLDRSIQTEKICDQSPGYGQFQYRTPSGLLCRVSDRKEGKDRSPGSGEIKYTTSSGVSDMDMKGREITDHLPCFEEVPYTTPSGIIHRDDARQAFEEILPRYGKFCYVTPSVLIHKDSMGQDSEEKSHQSGKFQFKMPSQLLAAERKRGESDDKSPVHHALRYSTPSLLLYKEFLRRQNVDASSPGHRVPMQDTLNKVKSRSEDEGYGYQEYTTPSQILEKSNKVTYASQSSPCLEYHYSTIPSQMLVRNFDREKPENVTQGYEFPGNVSPSELFNRRKALEKGKSKPSEGHVHQYLRYPSGPLQMQMYGPYETEHLSSDGEYQNITPSRVEVMNQRGPAEPMTGETSSLRHLLARDHDKYDEHNISVAYTSPPRFFEKREDRDQARRSKTAEYGAFIDSTPLRLINLENTTRHGQELSSLSAVLINGDLERQEEEAILYQHEYDNYVIADRNENASNNEEAESSVDPDCRMQPATIRHASTASLQKSESKVPATVQYTSSAGFHKPEREVPATIQYTSTADFHKPEREVPATVQYTSTTGFHKPEREVPATVQYTSSAGFHKSEREVPATVQNTSTAGFHMSECEVPATVHYTATAGFHKSESKVPATVQYTSTAGFHKSENEVPATVQYTSTAGFHKSEREVPATVQYTSTAGFHKSEREVPATTVQYTSTAGFHKSEREVPATTVQYTSTAGFHKSEREVPATTVQYTSNAGFHKSEREVPATVQYTSTAGFHKSEREVPATVQYTSNAGFHKLEREVPATVQYTSTAGFQKSESEVPATVQYTSTAGFHKSESKVPATVQYTSNAGFQKPEREVPATVQYTSNAGFQKPEREVPATVQYTSNAGFQKPEREVPATVQYTSTAGFHKSEREVPATVQYTSTAGFHKSEREVPATVQYTSSAGFHKSEREVPATVQYTSTAGFHKSEREVPATVQNTSTAGFHKSEREVPATVQYTSTAGFQKSESEVPATIQYASTASFNKLDSEVPPTIQHSSTSSFNKLECKAAVIIEQASSESFSKSENEVEHAEIIHRLMVVLGNTAVFLAAYTEKEIISLMTIMKTGQEKRSNKCWGKGNGPAESSVQRERCGSIAPFLGNQEGQEPHHVAWMTSVCTLKVLKASLTSKSEADLYQILVDIHSLFACANSFMKEHGNITLDPLIQSNSDYHTSIDRMDVVKGARRMSEPYRWFFSEEFVQTTTLHEFLNMIQNIPQIESSHIVLRSKPFRNVMDDDVSSAEITVPFRDSVHIQSLFSNPVHQSRIHTSDTQLKQLPQKMYRTVSSDVSAWDFSNISCTPPHTRRSVIWQNKDGSLSQSVGDFQDFLTGKLPMTHQSKRGSSFSLVINPSFNLSSDEEDLETARKQDSAKGQIVSTPRIKKYDKTNKKLFKQGVDKGKSPDRGQRLYGSSLGLNWQSDGKRGRGGGRPGTSPDARSFMMEREVIMSQNRKLQGEINTLHTENKLLKEKYNRTRAKIAELENELQEAQSELATLLETSNQEITELTNHSRSANQKDRQQLQSKILALTKENESFKLESASLEKQIESSRNLLDKIHQTGEKSKLLEAQKAELNAVNKQLGCLRALLEQSEQHFHKEEEQHSETRKQVQKLTVLNNLLQQQAGATHDEAVVDKQIQSLEKRLKVTEERLYQERADRANNLSQIEEKLLAENAQFQVIEKDLSRQLQREKEKNRNLERNIKDLREEIEKLHLALPFDESLLTLKKGNYSIPNSGHSSQRAESLRTNDMDYILAQIEKEDGLGAGQEQDIIRELWNKRKLAYMQLHELEIQLIELGISDNIAEGLKNLRDTCGQAETKMKQMEERLSDMQFEMASLENTYKQQLTVLVHERHDAFAHLKTAEDLLEALKTENQSLKLSLTGSQSATAHQGGSAGDKNAETELIRSQVQSLESQLTQVVRSNQLLEGELKTLDVQLNSRNLALQESKEELELLYANIKDDETSNRKQQTIDRLSAQVIDLNAEIGMWNDRNNTLLTENEKLEDTVAAVRNKEISMLKAKQQQRADLVQIEDLQEELDEKERKIEHQKDQLYELDGQLQKVRQDLYMEQEHTAELETEVESLQQTVTQRAQMFEVLIGSEREQLAQFQLLKDTLDSVSKELDQKKAQVKSLEIDLSLSKNRVEGLERDLQELRQERSYDTNFHPPPQSSMGDRLRIRELEGERTTLKQELAQLHSTVQLAEERASQAQKDLCQLESELVKGKTTILQLTAEKHDLEQHLEIAEENDSLIQERGQAEEDLVRLEKKLQEILEKFEQEARKQHSNFETRYVNISADSRKLLNELDSLRLLLEGKEREAEMIQDRSMRQQMEVSFLQRKVELIQNQMISNREDIARMVSELAIKMKEAVGTREVNQFLVNERAKLQTENYHLEKDLEKERETKVQIKKEMEEITKKIEKLQEHSKSTEKEAQNKANLIATIETDLRNATRNIAHLELEVSQQKNKIEHLNNDIKNLTNINTTLEKRFEMEKNTLAEEKETSRRLKDDVTNMTHKVEMLQHEHQLTQDKLATEQQTVEKLRNQSESYHEECERLKKEISGHKNDLDILRGQVLLGKDAVEKLKQEKEYLSHEYEVLCRHLNDKENELKLHREESLHKLDSLQRELYQEKTTQENNKTLIQKELDLSRSELEKLAEKLHQKEIQLQSFGRTLQELEAINREKREMEANVQRLETLVRDNKVILDGQRKEIMIHIEANSKKQELLAKAEATKQTLYGELRVHQENSQHEIRDLQITIKELQSQHEAERSALAETLTQSQSQLQASQSHLALAADARDKLQGRVRILERDLEEIKAKLSDESTGRHLTEHSVGSLRLQLEDTKNQKIVAEARLSETEKALAKAESQLKMEKEKLKKLSGRIQEAQVNSHSTESSVKAKQEQVDLLQKENNKLRQMLDSQKQSLTSKMKMSTLDLKQQLEMVQNERDKMSSQMQKLSTDLDQSREQIATKNKENYKLQEEILALEDQVRECKIKLKTAEDSLKTETAVQDQLTHRYAEQEEELKVLKNFLSKKAEESGDADKAMWHEMNRVIQDLSHQMQSHLESQKQNKEARESPQQIQKHKRQIMDLQGELATERSLHQIARDSLQALEEDCKRLRHQLHVLRRRESSASDKKYKNRMEAINAIIAKSQSQAQALLASGGYHDDISSPRPDYSIYSPRMGYRSPSPHMGYSSPQRAFSPDNSMASEFSIASTGPMVPTFESSASHKSHVRRN